MSDVNAGWRNLVSLVASLVVAAVGIYGIIVLGQEPHWIFLAAAGIAAVVVVASKIIGLIG